MQQRVAIPPSKRLPPNPHIGDGPVALGRALTSPSETDEANSEWCPEGQIDKSLRYRLLASDQRSFFTGSAACDLQAAHIINAVRINTERKWQVEELLTQQRIHPPMIANFFLDSVQNAILLEANLHTQWDLYGTFCFVPRETDAIAMLKELRTSNKTWMEMRHSAPQERILRPLDVSKPPFVRPYWEILVLYPHALLPDSQPLAIAQNRYLYQTGQTQSSTYRQTWGSWVVSGDRLSSLQQPSAYLDPFVAADLRDELYFSPVSSLAMVINAYYKLEQFIREHETSASERVRSFEKVISQLVTEIFFVPQTGSVSVVDVPVPAGPQQEVGQGLTVHGAPALGWTSATGLGRMMGPAYSATVEAATAEVPEVADADGLTNSEFHLLSSKATNPHLDGKERADAAVMMLFGTRRHSDPYVHGSQSMHG